MLFHSGLSAESQFTLFCMAGLSLRAEGQGFPQLLRDWPPATFIGK